MIKLFKYIKKWYKYKKLMKGLKKPRKYIY